VAQEGSKWVEVVEIDYKFNNFAALFSGNFLPVQMLYEGKTTKCHPAIKFPK